MNYMPDVLLLPSKLTAFTKDYNGSVIINPGFLTKGKGGGTFAEMVITAFDRENTEAVKISDKAHIVLKKI